MKLRTLGLLATLALLGCGRRAVPLFLDGWMQPDGGHDRDRLLDGVRDRAPKITCTPGQRLTYVVDDSARMYLFDPTGPKPLALVGTLACPLAGHPHSMAIRQDGVGYVLYQGGSGCTGLARVDLKTLACAAVPAFKCAKNIFHLFGMGYAIPTPTREETLFVADFDSPSLATLEPETGTMSLVGESPAESLELTGNARGELWGFTPRPSTAVFQLDPASGRPLKGFKLNIPLVPMGSTGWAFAAWADVFYVFYGSLDSGGTSIYRVTAEGQVTTFLSKTGIKVVGAGGAVCSGS